MSKKILAACALGLGVVSVCVLADAQRPAKAWGSPYAWCALFGATESQSTNCHYYTFEQCQAAVWGVGGHCYPNPTYAGPGPGGGPVYADPYDDDVPPPPRKYRRRVN